VCVPLCVSARPSPLLQRSVGWAQPGRLTQARPTDYPPRLKSSHSTSSSRPSGCSFRCSRRMPPSRQERRKAERDAAKRAPGRAGAAAAAGVVAGAAAAVANVRLNPRNPGGDWTTQPADPTVLVRALGAEVVRQRAAEGDREAQWSLGRWLRRKAFGRVGTPSDARLNSPEAVVGLALFPPKSFRSSPRHQSPPPTQDVCACVCIAQQTYWVIICADAVT